MQIRTPGECTDECDATPECTHYTWTNYQGGTCWMKKGQVTKNNAIRALPIQDAVCGIIVRDSPLPGEYHLIQAFQITNILKYHQIYSSII
jgi:hypothetical protein